MITHEKEEIEKKPKRKRKSRKGENTIE